MSSANTLAKEMQKIASNAQIQIQKLANQSTEKSFQYNAQEANSARTWQKMMSDTSHQREVADLKKAGLNPVLSTNQGAQSYTTSSASAQAVDPTSAYANIMGSQISGRATGYAADQSAAATRAAAASSAAAMRYAANQQAAASNYASYMAYKANLDKIEFNKWKVKNQPQKTVYGIIDKYFGTKFNIPDKVVGKVADLAKNVNATWFKNDDIEKVNKNNFVLSKHGERMANKGLNLLHVGNTKFNRHLWIRANVFGDESAMKALSNRSRMSIKSKYNSSRSVANRYSSYNYSYYK